EIGTYSCFVGINGAPCKHQGAVSMKFHLSMFNFIPSLTPNDRANYTYIALGYVAHDNSFYASLHAQQVPQQENLQHSEAILSNTSNINNETSDTSDIEWKEPNEDREDIDISPFVTFLEEVKLDYQNAGEPLRVALDKFKERYNVAKSKSISWLSSYLYDLNHNVDPMARVKSGAQIRVQ
ncbi:5642_t:CDS:1, partial [Racocetra persica]